MRYLLNFIYAAVLSLYVIVGVVPRYRRHDVLGGFWSKLRGITPDINAAFSHVWFHAAGVGEVLLCQPVIEQLTQLRPDLRFVISVFSPDGLKVAREIFPDQCVIYVPYDFTTSVRRVCDNVKPVLFAISENDLWPNLIREVGQRGVPIAIINTRITPREQTEHRWNGWLIRPSLKYVCWWGAVDHDDARWIKQLFGVGSPPVQVTGSLKFDGVVRERTNPRTRSLWKRWGFNDSERILLAGSTHAPEEEQILEMFDDLRLSRPTLRLVLAPRNVLRMDEIEDLLQRRGIPYLRSSKLSVPQERSAVVTVVDTIGHLRDAWGLADFGFVGGSLCEHGGHNLVEPASYGIPICFGPHVWNVQFIATELLRKHAAVQVTSVEQCRETFKRWLDNPDEGRALGERARQVVAQNSISLSLVLNAILRLLPPEASPDQKDVIKTLL